MDEKKRNSTHEETNKRLRDADEAALAEEGAHEAVDLAVAQQLAEPVEQPVAQPRLRVQRVIVAVAVVLCGWPRPSWRSMRRAPRGALASPIWWWRGRPRDGNRARVRPSGSDNARKGCESGTGQARGGVGSRGVRTRGAWVRAVNKPRQAQEEGAHMPWPDGGADHLLGLSRHTHTHRVARGAVCPFPVAAGVFPHGLGQ